MSSRRKSTTPCMVLPSNVVEQEAVEEKPERTKEDEAGDEEEEEERKGKEVLSAFQAQQSAAAAAAAVSQSQLLIPLSSIPSYSAAMDSNPLLINTYRKFPYPSLAEISSLASQTQFTEEQIKVWFSAQRLKHGVSWTPEEVEEARRKQFNGTVHTVPQTITVIPAHQLSAAANGLQSILQTCQIVGQPGLVFTQVGGNLPVTSPITLTVAGLPSQSQSSSRVSCQSTPTNSELKRATTVQPPSLNTVLMANFFPSLTKENSALSADSFSLRPKKSKEQLAELKASYLKNHFASDAEIARLMKLTNLTKGEIKKWFSDTRYNQRNSKNIIDSSDETPTWNPFPDFTLQKFKEKTPEQLVVLEESFEKSSIPSDEELSRLRTETKLTRREIDAWFNERRKVPAQLSGGGGGSKKDLKEKSKKTPEQLHILKSAFVRTQWPTPEEYDQLAEESGLPRHYIVSWFGDSRYSWKNGNLKWFFQYQSGNVEGPSEGGGGDVKRSPPSKKFKTGREILKEYYLKHHFLSEQDLDELVTKTNMSYEQVGDADFKRKYPETKSARDEGEETRGERSENTEEPAGAGAGDEEDDEDDEEDDGDETDDSEVWEPSRSVRKSLSLSED
uniref:Zinc fingers and homeoboxes protein 1 n=1 Tax=Xiphophorus couchianus TaxID=32473 RepID=A0A3B5MN44_9TELE